MIISIMRKSMNNQYLKSHMKLEEESLYKIAFDKNIHPIDSDRF